MERTVPWCFGCTSGLQLLSSQTLGTLFKISLFYFLSLLWFLQIATCKFHFVIRSVKKDHFHPPFFWESSVFWKAISCSSTPSYWQTQVLVRNLLSSSFSRSFHWRAYSGCVLVIQSCPTLCDPMDCSPPGSSVLGILQARLLKWVAMPFSRESSQPRDQTQVSLIAGRFFTIWASREAQAYFVCLSAKWGADRDAWKEGTSPQTPNSTQSQSVYLCEDTGSS